MAWCRLPRRHHGHRDCSSRAASAARSHPDVRDRLQDLDRGRAAVWQVVRRGLADLLPRDSAAQRRPGGVHVDGRAAFLAGGEQEGDLILVAGEPDGHGHAGAHHALGPWRVAYLGVLQDVLDLPDPGLLLALLLLGGVVPAVLAQVALFSSGLDLLRDLYTRGAGQIVKLRFQPVVCFLGEPGNVLACLGHGYSLPAMRTGEVRWSQRGPMGVLGAYAALGVTLRGYKGAGYYRASQ